MGVIRKNEESLVETDKIKRSSRPAGEDSTVKTQNRQKGFLRSTIAELKKVKWPKIKYTLGWGLTVMIFTIILSGFIMFFDSIFDSSVKYTTCTSSKVETNRTNGNLKDESLEIERWLKEGWAWKQNQDKTWSRYQITEGNKQAVQDELSAVQGKIIKNYNLGNGIKECSQELVDDLLYKGEKDSIETSEANVTTQEETNNTENTKK